MRILLYTPSSWKDPTFGVVLAGLGGAYRRLGHEVSAQDRPAAGAWGWPLAFLRLLRALGRVDLAHAHTSGTWTPALGLLALACRLRGVPYAATVLSFDPRPPRARSRLRRAAMDRFLRGSLRATALSKAMARELAAELPAARSMTVLPYGFDPGERESLAAPDARVPRGPFVLCLARLAPYKGIDVLLMAWKDSARPAGTRLVVCGPDMASGHYQSLARLLGISDSVVFTGEADRALVWGLLRSCLFLVLPSRREAFGIALVEAMASGKAVLATRSGGPEEIVADGRTGLLVPPQDPASLSAGLARLLADEELRARLGAAARDASGRYAWEALAPAYLGARA